MKRRLSYVLCVGSGYARSPPTTKSSPLGRRSSPESGARAIEEEEEEEEEDDDDDEVEEGGERGEGGEEREEEEEEEEKIDSCTDGGKGKEWAALRADAQAPSTPSNERTYVVNQKYNTVAYIANIKYHLQPRRVSGRGIETETETETDSPDRYGGRAYRKKEREREREKENERKRTRERERFKGSPLPAPSRQAALQYPSTKRGARATHPPLPGVE